MALLDYSQWYASVDSITGQILRARIPRVAVGEICAIHASLFSDDVIGKAQVVALSGDTAIMTVLHPVDGFRRECVVRATGDRVQVEMSVSKLGTVLDASGLVVERLSDAMVSHDDQHTHSMPLDSMGPLYAERDPLTRPLWTGIRAIDGLLTCAIGQRIGIFAAAGSGKSSLLSMLVGGVDADVTIVALIGERGREVSEFVAGVRSSGRAGRTIVVYATSDQSAVERANAAKVAMAAAEFFRDKGARVVVYIDSLTRYARAERDIALASGELPVKRGYPLSVFDRLPKLIERAGCTYSGSITTFYTVLLESEEEADLVADEFRSLLDGHIYLSRKLTEIHHYPAIDILKSASRLFNGVTTAEQQRMAAVFRQRLSKYQELQVYIDMGEYRRGQNAENDQVLDRYERMRQFLVQSGGVWSSAEETQRLMHEATATA
ncbi:FliI/YscN family ATPase [Robbsia andropogonis]|uniref:FliI/YscN family ATPase n=1 Tax=Robbsia andropogonis TaxID=28092 RepID=UPI003D1A1123